MWRKTMNRINSTCLLLIVSGSAALGQPRLLDCREVRQLLSQPGLNMSAELESDKVVPSEVLEPNLVMRNTTKSVMTIPVLSPKDGINVTVLQRKVNPKAKDGFTFREIEHRVIEVTDRTYSGCAFSVRQLFPGEEERIHLPALNQEPWEPGPATLNPFQVAQRAVGLGQYVISIAESDIRGRYEVVEPKTIHVACVIGAKTNRPGGGLPSCTVIRVVRWDGRYLILTQVAAGDREVAELEKIRRFSREEEKEFAYSSSSSVRLATYGQEPILPRALVGKAVDWGQLEFQLEGRMLPIASIWDSYGERVNAWRAGRRSPVR